MRKLKLIPVILIVLLLSCTTNKPIIKSVAYKGIYDENPLTVLLMPPINRSTNVECKEYFHSTLNVPIANAGFYVIPPFLSMEILKKESAYDSELFFNGSLKKLGEVFGADLVLFTIISKWDKSSLASNVYIDIEYVLKSTKTNQIVYTRKGSITYDASVKTGATGMWGALADLTASALNTAGTDYVEIARICNAYTFKDMPYGKYSPLYRTDSLELSGSKEFNVKLNSKSK